MGTQPSFVLVVVVMTSVSILLAHPTIDVKLSNYNGETPF